MAACLRHEQHFAVGVVEASVLHRPVRNIQMRRTAVLGTWVAESFGAHGAQSSLMLLALISLPQRSRSARVYSVIWAGVPGRASSANVWKRALTAVEFSASTSALLSRATVSFDAPAGTTRP